MLAAETANDDERQEKMARCSQAIVDLWTNADIFPDGIRPFQSFEPVFRTMESLDPNDNTPRYFRPARRPDQACEDDGESNQWLEIADGLDHTARMLIRYCLARASEVAIDKTKEWVTAAKTVAAEEKPLISVIGILSDEANLFETPSTAQRKELEERVKRLDGFAQMAAALSDDIRARLKLIDDQEP